MSAQQTAPSGATTRGRRRVWTFGEAMAALISPGDRPAEHASSVEVGTGGAEYNLAIGLARLGHAVTYVSVVGDDPWGRRLRRELLAEGVDAQLRITNSAFTGAYLREHRTQHLVRATYLRRGSAASTMNSSDTARIKPKPGDVVHLTGLTGCLSETCAEAWVDIAARTHDAGAQVSLDVNYRSAVANPEQAARAFASVAAHVDTVFASADEAAIVTGRAIAKPADAADVLRQSLPESADIVIKNGADGSLHRSADGALTEAAAIDVAVTDLVGAGDAFAAGYLSALLDEEPVQVRLQRGHICAAFVVSTNGDWEGAPTRAELALANTLSLKEVHR